jgi:double-stranded uracil-DNA glycosylase
VQAVVVTSEGWARPSRAELAAAQDGSVPDLVGPGLRVLLCGINPSLASAAIGHHFGNQANRLWPVLHLAGFTERRLHPMESGELLARGIGVTNFVNRATATAAEVSAAEVIAGVERLRAIVRRWRPAYVAFLGLGAYRLGFRRPRAGVGPQEEDFEGSAVWLLPNPSGLNAHYQLPQLVEAYAALRTAAFPPSPP